MQMETAVQRNSEKYSPLLKWCTQNDAQKVQFIQIRAQNVFEAITANAFSCNADMCTQPNFPATNKKFAREK